MILHTNENDFKTLVRLAAEHFGIRPLFIEKDYWVTLVLKNLSKSKYRDHVVFKGGTSLSKVYKIISRFSEDIDLAYIDTQKKRCQDTFSKIDKDIMKSPLEYEQHEDEKKGPAKFRKTYYKYPRYLEGSDFGHATDKIILEINSYTRPSPSHLMPVESYIGDYLKHDGKNDIITEFELDSFNINVLNKEKTLAEKLCGLAKYSNKEDEKDFAFLKRKIRHIYDVSKLLDDPELKIKVKEDSFVEIVKSVRIDDIESFGDDKWIKKKFSEAKIYSDTENVLEKIKDHYNNSFSELLYSSEELPKLEYISEQIKEVYICLQKVDEIMSGK